MDARQNQIHRAGGRRAWWLPFLVLSVAVSSCTLLVGRFEGSDGTGGSSGHGGTGGTTTSGCMTPDDCPPPTNSCVKNTCANHACGTQFESIGSNLMPDPAKNCKANQCDGNGNFTAVPDPTNVPVPTNPCLVGVCNAMGQPDTAFVAAGMTCMSTMVCDGAGNCVACLKTDDCPSGQSCTAAHNCVPAGCTNGVPDGMETDQDCGGGGTPPCDRCADGKKCLMASDCLNQVCTQGVCQPSTCTDGIKNGAETDQDCGGGGNTCPRCGPDKMCTTGTDCAGGQCGGGTCTPDCSDGVVNGTETDQDCGGTCATHCAVGKKCKLDSDCASSACDANTLTCVTDQCSDHHQDGTETDSDCGGSCPGCGVGKKCTVNADCTSNACDLLSKFCVGSPCNDHQEDGTETDVDCGGACASKCAVGKKCAVNADCTTSACDAVSFTCDSSQCVDKKRDGTETDVDCGGGACSGCGAGGTCSVDTDCTSNACNNVTNKCASQCADQKKDGAETDVDCGGGTCSACAINKKCAVNTDCTSNACNGVTLICIADQCSDQKKDGAETDTDCGGGACSKCANGKVCAVNTDCTSNACDFQTFTCVASQCGDHHQDGTETDSDCGGTCPSKCATGLKCLIDTDCATQACDSVTKVCDASPCSDKHKDGAETDIDCGGGTCPACANGKVCSLDSDCTSTACNNVTGTCATSKCTDQKKDGAETDVDCGGGTCGTCANGKKCQLDSDCTSNACDAVSLTCIADQCADHRKDGIESDVDCGGGICGKCGLGLKCAGDTDCLSSACDAISLTCVSNQCADHRQDGAETDVDCGGGTCSACLVGQKCLVNFDCQSGHICNASKVCQ